MLACTRLGAPHTVVFGGFSADSLSDRTNDMGCEVLITQDEAWRRGATVPLKRTADEAMAAAPGVRACLVVRRTGNEVPMKEGRDRWYHDFDVPDDPATCPCEPMDAEDLLFLMYTSGTTAKPKGIAHTTGGYLVGVATTHHYVFDLEARARTSTGARPTSAGSPGTATSSTGRSATAPPRCSTRARPTSRTRSAGGRSSSATASRSSTRRRPRSART